MRHLVSLLLIAVACSSESNAPRVSKEPTSVRGWIADVEGSTAGTFKTVETEMARKAQLFYSTNVWVDNAPYVSGGVAENGSFLLLDVPPGNQTIEFSAPGAPAAKLVLQNIPGNADIFIPGLVLKKDTVTVLDPREIRVRMAAHIKEPKPSGATAIVAGVPVPIVDTPLSAMIDRHDYPNPPGTFTPLLIVK